MRIRYLQAFRAVMETGSVTEAAQTIYLTQPQVSRLIVSLEDELGLRLFVRTGRRLVPTEEGLRFYDETKRVFAGIDEIYKIAADIRAAKEPRLRVMSQPYLAYALLPESFAAFEKLYPDLRFSLEIRSRGDVGPWVAGQQFDLGLAALPINFPAARPVKFASAATVAALPKGHHLARKDRLTAGEIAAEPFIALRPFTLMRRFIDSTFHSVGFSLAIRAETSTGLSVCQMVSKGLGVSIVDPLVAKCIDPDFIEIRKWDPGLKLRYGFVYSEAYAPSALTLEFAKVVAATAKRMAPDYIELVSKDDS